MRSLASWIKRSPLAPRDAVGWALRIARGIVSLHDMGVAHGRISAGAFFSDGTGCDAEGMMLDVDRADRLVTFMSARRARERGATNGTTVSESLYSSQPESLRCARLRARSPSDGHRRR